jgi:hypothetical protein
MVTSFDVITPTSIGTAVAKTQLGTITKPTESSQLIEIIPYFAPTGAITAGESFLTETAIESNSINLLPKRFINPPITSGLGTAPSCIIPMLEAYECFTPLTQGGTEQIQAYGQAQVANTAGLVVGVDFHFSDNAPSQAEQFYTKPDNETATGTTATTVAGNTITVNGGTMLTKLYPVVTGGVVTASQSYIATMQFNSNDFGSSQALEVPCQPIGSALGSNIGTGIPKMASYKNVNMPMKSSCTINTVLRLSEAITASGNFIGGLAYQK